jgi:hypothetical protein
MRYRHMLRVRPFLVPVTKVNSQATASRAAMMRSQCVVKPTPMTTEKLDRELSGDRERA